MPDLLIELFSEEIPARMQARARDDLKRMVTDGLVEAGLTYASAGAFSTPRRLVLAVEGLTTESRAVREERKGPRADAPAAALDGFLRSTGLTRDQLELRDEKKGQVFFAVIEKPGRPAAAIVAQVLEATIRDFPWPKSMRWGAGTLRWVRPLHSILCLLSDEGGAEVVPLSVDGIVAGATTEGHRFMAPGAFAVTSFADYRAKLKRAFVVLDSAEREAQIWHDATTQAFAQGLEVVPDAALLTEVAGLVEWPVVLMGPIGEAFLGLPPEVLQTSMREHQKFFSVKNPRSGRIERFVTVANRETADHGATILAGNQKVLTARLSDARFFWENDLSVVQTVGMEGMAAGLANVTFHNKLGSQADRIARIEALSREIAPLVGAAPDLAAQAARVAKADLQSAMVGEFPELQGTMGGYYARAAGLPEAVALACKAHYSPLGPSDDVPSDPVSVAVALADKIDTLTGFWAIDEKPTGSKDPFALRRAALGVIRLVLGEKLRLDIMYLISRAYANVLTTHYAKGFEVFYRVEPDNERTQVFLESLSVYIMNKMSDPSVSDMAFRGLDARADVYLMQDIRPGVGFKVRMLSDDDLFGATKVASFFDIASDLLAFLHDRLKVYLRDQGIRHDVIDACLAMPGNDDLTLLVKRAQALAAVLKTEDGASMVQGFKRANNIWMQAMSNDGFTDSDVFKKAIEILNAAEVKDGVEYSYGPDIKFAEAPEELALFTALDQAEAAIAPAVRAEDFATAMAAMAQLRAPVDAFFTAVQVNSDKQVLRRNRLNLLHRIRAICLQVADLTKVES